MAKTTKRETKQRRKAAAALPAGKPARRKADPHAAVRKLDALFRSSPPPEAAEGRYAPRKDDPLANPPYPHPVADGSYRVAGSPWIFSFAGGRLIQATRSEHKTLIPGALTEIPAAA